MIPTKGYAVQDAVSPLAPFGFDRRDPGTHDVLIDIKYCGICHSDIHQAKSGWGPGALPDGARATKSPASSRRSAPGVTRYKVGDRVGVGCFVDSCRTCEPCKTGLDQYCEAGCTFTYNGKERDGVTLTQGGYSERIVVNEDYVLRIPDRLPLDAAAPLLCAGITVYSPLRHWHAGPGRKVAVVGLGGLGHMAVKFAHALGAHVTVLSQSLRKEADARRMGADEVYAHVGPRDVQDTGVALRPDDQYGLGRDRLEPVPRPARSSTGRWCRSACPRPRCPSRRSRWCCIAGASAAR